MTAALENEIADLRARVDRLEAILGNVAHAFGGGRSSSSSSSTDKAQEPATARMMDHAKGNPVVKNTPRDWKGASMKGKKFSECPPEFLDVLAETYDYFAARNDEKGEKTTDGKPKSSFDVFNARLARGWAKRIRDGYVPPAKAAPRANPFGAGGAPPPPAGPPAGPPPPVAGPLGGPVHNPFAPGAPSPFPARAPAAAPPSPPPKVVDLEGDDTSFDFGANAKTPEAPTPPAAASSAPDGDDDAFPEDDAREPDDKDDADAFPDAADEEFEEGGPADDAGDAPF